MTNWGCANCLLDPSNTVQFSLNSNGICEECRSFELRREQRWYPDAEKDGSLERLLAFIRKRGIGREFDCVLGVSGGVDSSYLALKLKEFGLRVLAVHVDNSWNSELAVWNIGRVLDYCHFDLQTVILNTGSFFDLQKAFLRASVPDIEIPTDHAIQATLWQVAKQRRIPTVVSGMNFATESSRLKGLTYGPSDWVYIRGVWTEFGEPTPATYPHMTLSSMLNLSLKGYRLVSLLNYMPYNKIQVAEELNSLYGWKPYPGKHFESVYTRWVQGWWLPHKFGIDKKIVHVSDLIRSGTITQEEGRRLIQEDDYPEEIRRKDEKQILGKFSMSENDLENLLATPTRSYREFPNSELRIRYAKRLLNILRETNLYPR